MAEILVLCDNNKYLSKIFWISNIVTIQIFIFSTCCPTTRKHCKRVFTVGHSTFCRHPHPPKDCEFLLKGVRFLLKEHHNLKGL